MSILESTEKRRYAIVTEMPAVLSLPSGLKLPTSSMGAHALGDLALDKDGKNTYGVTELEANQCIVFWLGAEEGLKIDDPRDAAAIHSCLSRLGYEADAPVLKGEDADGDGLAGEN